MSMSEATQSPVQEQTKRASDRGLMSGRLFRHKSEIAPDTPDHSARRAAYVSSRCAARTEYRHAKLRAIS